MTRDSDATCKDLIGDGVSEKVPPLRRVAPPRPPPRKRNAPPGALGSALRKSSVNQQAHNFNTADYRSLARSHRARQLRIANALLAAVMQSALDAALEYAARGWPVFPVRFNRDPNAKKYPLTENGMKDATRDEAVIREWWKRWPNAVPSILTGEPSGVIALDIDLRRDGSGFDSLEELGVYDHPEAPTAHTPRGGCAVLFKWPG